MKKKEIEWLVKRLAQIFQTQLDDIKKDLRDFRERIENLEVVKK